MIPFPGQAPIMGEAARLWLSHAQRGKVLAAVNHATYLLTETGELVWLAAAESPRHRRCILWPLPLPRPAVDSTFTIRGRSIILGPGTYLNFRNSQLWSSPVLTVGDVIEIGQIPAKLFAVCDLILARETPVGVGTFIQPALQIAKQPGSSTGFQPDDILTQQSWPVVERITRACMSHDLPAVLIQAEALIGLGEGLTPSGDDFLGGLFFARHLLACAYPHLLCLKLSNLPEWVDAYRSNTNLISFVLLKDNISGHALDPLNHFGVALLTNQPLENASSAASDLIKVGHSTGWSLLAGFLVGMLLACKD